jgi:hypothetical protein
MIVATRLSEVFRLTAAAALCIAVTQSIAVAQISDWLPEPGSYFTDGYQPLRGDEASIISVSQCGAAVGCDCGGCDCNTCCRPRWSCVAGTEITFLVPEIDDGRMEATISDPAATNTVNNGNLDLHDMLFAPRVWLGVHRGCWGIVGRFWYLDTSDSEFDPFEADGFGYSANSDLEMQTIDLELTRDMCLRGRKVTGSVGVRYASFDHTTRMNTVGQSDADDVIYTTSALFRQFSRGTGITGSLSGDNPIGCTCVSWFYNVRGSLLFRARGDTLAETESVLGANLGQASDVHGASAQIEDPFLIAELQLGLMAEHRLQCYPADAFVRVAFEFQHWSGDESKSSADSATGIGVTSFGETESFTAGLDTNLFGLSIGTGLTY